MILAGGSIELRRDLAVRRRRQRPPEVAGDRRPVAHLFEGRLDLRAEGLGIGTTSSKVASRRRVGRARDLAAEYDPAGAFSFWIGDRDRRNQGLGVRMPRRGEQRRRPPDLDDPSEVHDRRTPRDAAHHVQVVRDEQVRDPEVSLQVRKQL